MQRPRTLLLPCAGRSSRYPTTRPKWLLTMPEGKLLLKRAADSIATDQYERVVIAIRDDHESAYGCRNLLRDIFGERVDIVVLPDDTRGPADTIAHTIRAAGVNGPILIKDCDSFFMTASFDHDSFVAIADIRNYPDLTNLAAKSYVILNGAGDVTDLVEKSVASNLTCAGLYGYADAQRFLEHFTVEEASRSGEIFVSHVLARAIRRGERLARREVSDFVDVGTIHEWRRYVRARGTIVCDLDGVVFKNQSRYFPPLWNEPAEPIDANVAVLRDWQKRGAQLVFVTARPGRYRERTESDLAHLGLKAHALIMDCHHGRRFLVNDHAASNPYPAAVGISLERDRPALGELLHEWQ